ncbi:MAG: amino acid ABC transporter permease [Thalassobaculum sp.]|uniref:amino acid ABC transporter permease n=1 Tax=Thalassobaculum sp. TaxID=2022740 RepID=UPI0032EAC234
MAETMHEDTVFRPKPSLPPPPNTVGVVGWLRKNLFGGPFDSILTIVGGSLIAYFAYTLYLYGIANAVWSAGSYRECLDITRGNGACWAGVSVWMNNYFYGRYPDVEQWRVNLAGVILAVWLAPFWFPKVKAKIATGISAVLTYPFLAAAMLLGGEVGWFLQIMVGIALTAFAAVWLNVAASYAGYGSLRAALMRLSGFENKDERLQKYVLIGAFVVGFVLALLFQATWDLAPVPTVNWGGLFLTLVISGIAISSALPTGVILALGRRSKMPVIRVFCTAFIELFRSVPLITILFMAVTMMPLFLPVEVNLDKLVLVIIAVCIFAAAYMAEIVRGGLQAINKGQYEAAQAMGLNYWKMMTLIIMPQALKLMIPNIVGNFIGLLKDTTLVSIIGLYDILLMAKASGQDTKWLGMHTEPFLFTAAVFFVICFCMSKYSQHLERTIGGGYGRR